MPKFLRGSFLPRSFSGHEQSAGLNPTSSSGSNHASVRAHWTPCVVLAKTTMGEEVVHFATEHARRGRLVFQVKLKRFQP